MCAVVAIPISLILLAPTSFYRPFEQGRDPNWQLALHYAFAHDLVFGKDIVFTYGPLGFLYSRLVYPETSGYLLLFDFFTYVLFCTVLVLSLRRLRLVTEVLACILLCYAVGTYRQPLDSSIIYLFFSFFFLAHGTVAESRLSSLIGIGCAVFSFFLKISCGIVALGFALLLLSARLLSDTNKREATLLLVTTVCSFCVAWMALPVDLLAYLSSGLELISGFGHAMHRVNPNTSHFFTMAGTSFLLFGAGALFSLPRWASRLPLVVCMVLTTAFLFLLFKQGFVRADGHIRDFMQYAPLAVVLCYPLLPQQLRFYQAPFALGVLCFSFSQHEEGFTPAALAHKVSALSFYTQEYQTPIPATFVPEPRSPDRPLDQEILARIGTDSVDIFPFQSHRLLRHHLNYGPRPVLHSYAAYTPALDRLNAEYFASEFRPKFFILTRARLDDRYPGFDEALTRVELYRWYQPVIERKDLILFERRDSPRSISLAPLETHHLAFDTAFTLPTSGDLQFAVFDIKFSLLGRVIGFFYKPPPLYLELKQSDGTVIRSRAIAPQLSAPVPISHLVVTLAEELQFYRGEVGQLPKVQAITLNSSWPWGVTPEFTLRLFKVDAEATS
jgi:hypothetical protein